MKIIIKKNILDEILEIASRFVDPINSLFGYRCIKITTSQNIITFKATNEVISIIKSIDIDNKNIIVEEHGEVLVQCSLLKNIVKKLTNFIEIKTDKNNNMEIIQGDSRYTLNTVEVERFVNFEKPINLKKFEIDTEEFKKAIKNVVFAIGSDTNFIYRCINFKSKGNKLNLAATDTYRLAYYSINMKTPLEDFEFNISGRDVKEMIPVDAPKKITAFYNSLNFGIEYDNTIVLARITDLPYHDIESLFNQTMEETKYKITIDKKELNSLMNKIWLNTNDKQNRIEIKINKSEFSIYTRLDEIGDSFVKTSNYELEGGSLDFDINYNYLKDALSILDGEVIMLINDKVQKILFLSKANPNSKQIVSPMRK